MIDITVRTRINRPVDRVFAYVADTTNEAAWNTDLVEARRTKDGPIGKGTTFHVRNKPSMGVSEGTAEVVDFEPNRRHVLQADYGRMKPKITHLFESVDGATTLTRRVQFELPGMMRPLVRKMARNRNSTALANLKRVLEQQ